MMLDEYCSVGWLTVADPTDVIVFVASKGTNWVQIEQLGRIRSKWVQIDSNKSFFFLFFFIKYHMIWSYMV